MAIPAPAETLARGSADARRCGLRRMGGAIEAGSVLVFELEVKMPTIEEDVATCIEGANAARNSKAEDDSQKAMVRLITGALRDINRIAAALEKLAER
jgi:hypothetical protein